jgi:hypothetical protein
MRFNFKNSISFLIKSKKYELLITCYNLACSRDNILLAKNKRARARIFQVKNFFKSKVF